MKLLKAKEVQKPSMSGGSFAHFSSCWEKQAAGGTFLSKLPTGEKIHKEGTDSHDQSAPPARNDRAIFMVIAFSSP